MRTVDNKTLEEHPRYWEYDEQDRIQVDRTRREELRIEATKRIVGFNNMIHLHLDSEEPRLARRDELMLAALNEAWDIANTRLDHPMFDDPTTVLSQKEGA